MDFGKNIYGLSEGIFKACLYLGLKFPLELPKEFADFQEHFPSDYFGDDFELDETTKKKLWTTQRWTKEKFDNICNSFSKKFFAQKSLKHTNTDLNIYLCDFLLLFLKTGATDEDYFHFEFYAKPIAFQDKFIMEKHRNLIRRTCNDPCDIILSRDKVETDKLFADFLHRDWLDTRTCTFEDFKSFVEKHPRFLSKAFNGTLGKGIAFVDLASKKNLEEIFINLRSQKRLLEEIIIQHEEIAAFCPDTVNTIRINTFLDVHNVVHILTTSGRFGRTGGIVDNVLHGGGYSVVIDPKTGIIISDGLSREHEFAKKHADTGKVFKGFQYPCWKEVCATVKSMARMTPQLRHIGWDISVNNKNEVVVIETNGRPDVGLQQSADGVGKLHLYQPLLEELKNYKKAKMRLLGYRVNNLRNFDSAYQLNPHLWNSRRKFALDKLMPECISLIDLGCRKDKFVKTIIPPRLLKYYPVDFQKHDDEIIACNFNEGEFPDIEADACLCTLVAEYVELLPQFLANICNAAQKQVLMICRPVDKELYDEYRWGHPFLTDFTEEFLIAEMKRNAYQLVEQYPVPDRAAIILYDFRKISS